MKSTYLFFLLLFAKSESLAFLFPNRSYPLKLLLLKTIEHYYYLLTYYKTRERERDNIIGITYIYYNIKNPPLSLSLSPST